MAKVPQYGGPQVRDQALEGGFQRAPDVSSGLMAAGRALGQAGEVFDRADLLRAQSTADTVDTQITAEWMKWDAENRKNFRGQNVDAYEPAAQEWWKKAAETYGANLDPRAKSLVGKALNRKQMAAYGNVAQFVAGERERHADDTAAASINTTIQFGVTSGDVAGASEQVREQVAKIGARKGWTTEQVQAEQVRNLSQLHLAQISKLTEEDAAKAQAYYNAAKDRGEIAFAAQARVEQILKAETDNQFATQEAARVAQLPLDEQLAEAAKITDPQRREKTLSQIKNNHAMVKEAERAQQEQFSDKAWQLVGQGQRVPEAILAGMDGKERVQLQDHLRAKSERAADRAAGKALKTDTTVLAKLYDMMREDPEGFKKLRLETLTPFMGGSDIEQVARIQRDANKPDREKDVATTTQLMGTYTGGWKPEKKAAFSQTFLDELHQFEKEKGRPASYEDKRKIGDRLVLDGEVLTGKFYLPDANKKFYQATPEERARFAPTITSSDRKLVRAALEAEGVKNPTEAQVLERFKLAKGIR